MISLLPRRYLKRVKFYFQLNDENIMNVIDGLYGSWGKLITSATNIYKRSNAMRVVVKGDF